TTLFRSGEEQELVDLVRGDVDQDAAIRLLVEEPVRPDGAVEPVGAQANRLDDAADRALGDQPGGGLAGADDETFRKADREYPAGLASRRLAGGDLVQCRRARLVDHPAPAGSRGAARGRRAVARGRGAAGEV